MKKNILKVQNLLLQNYTGSVFAYGNSKLLADYELRKMASKHFRMVIVRSPMVYCPGCKGNFAKRNLDQRYFYMGVSFPELPSNTVMIEVITHPVLLKVPSKYMVQGPYRRI